MPSPSINDALSVLPAKINLFRVEFTSFLPDRWPLLNVRKSPFAPDPSQSEGANRGRPADGSALQHHGSAPPSLVRAGALKPDLRAVRVIRRDLIRSLYPSGFSNVLVLLYPASSPICTWPTRR